MRKITTMAALAALLALLLTACNYPGVTQDGTPNGSPGGATPAGVDPTSDPLFPAPGGTQPIQPSLPPATNIPPTGSLPPQAVVLVGSDDELNVRQGPGTDQPIISALQPQAAGITLTGQTEMVGAEQWVEIQLPNGTGWVYAWYLTEQVSQQEFCADPQLSQLIQNLEQALLNEDGELLASLVSPIHGLNVQYLRSGTVANYSPQEAGAVFNSDFVIEWGAHPGSGNPVEGTFQGELLPTLVDVFASDYTTHCNEMVTGGATYDPTWPPYYGNINFVSLHKPGSEQTELDWRTWAAGIEYVNGQPYLFALLHYFWEP